MSEEPQETRIEIDVIKNEIITHERPIISGNKSTNRFEDASQETWQLVLNHHNPVIEKIIEKMKFTSKEYGETEVEFEIKDIRKRNAIIEVLEEEHGYSVYIKNHNGWGFLWYKYYLCPSEIEMAIYEKRVIIVACNNKKWKKYK